MTERVAAKPTLVSIPEAEDAAPALRGSRCRCGQVAFPPQPLGCNACGAAGADVETVDLDARGTLLSHATAYRGKQRRNPTFRHPRDDAVAHC